MQSIERMFAQLKTGPNVPTLTSAPPREQHCDSIVRGLHGWQKVVPADGVYQLRNGFSRRGAKAQGMSDGLGVEFRRPGDLPAA